MKHYFSISALSTSLVAVFKWMSEIITEIYEMLGYALFYWLIHWKANSSTFYFLLSLSFYVTTFFLFGRLIGYLLQILIIPN